MKKLTAGIFATILGLTAIDAYAAMPEGVSKVATTNYVQGALNSLATVAKTGSYTDLKNVPTDLVTKTDIANMATKTDIADMATKTDIADMATTGDVAAAKLEAVNAAANAAAGLYETKESAKAYETKANASATYATKDEIKDIATSGQITTLDTRVGTIEADYLKAADIANMATTGDVATAKSEAISEAATAAAGLYETKTHASETYATKTSVTDGLALKADASTVSDLAKDVGENTAAIEGVVSVNEKQSNDIATNATHIKTLQDATGNYITWADVDNSYGD